MMLNISNISTIYYFILCSSLITNIYGFLPLSLSSMTSQTPLLQWTGATFDWPSPLTKALYKNAGKYINKNVIGTRAQMLRDDVFIALPRYKSGVPATLIKTSISGKCSTCSPTVFKPFPSWTAQEEGNCQALQSVVDIFLDHTNQILWALDVGVIETLENPQKKCPAKILAINVQSGKVLKTIQLDRLTTMESRLQYLTVDYANDGRIYVYVSDAATRAIITYDVQASKGFRIILPDAVSDGQRGLDVLYITLIRKSAAKSESSHLYFTYLGSNRMFSMSADDIENNNLKSNDESSVLDVDGDGDGGGGESFSGGRIKVVGYKPNNIVIIGTDNGPSIFFRNEGQSEVYRWDTNTPFEQSNFRAVYRSNPCQLATHAMADYRRGRMRVLESNFPDFMQDASSCGVSQQISAMEGL